ncbi:hypothetical protein E1A91_D04G095200v1 [Gossypium mustelinum]|uniref:Glutamate receptor n=1 Tax=Gossypium mustelinum TaxID=34275 RepID=A0A5D2VBU7_GOSMU|nr:hypothetical protein E1A91_D04G095200v1 [Gossypium mustelinum]
MPKYSKHCFSFFPFLLFSYVLIGFTIKLETASSSGLYGTRDSTRLVYNIGVVVDVNSNMGAMANICLSMALSDFYAKHPNYETRLSLQRWESLGAVAAAPAVGYLPQTSAEASFAIQLGDNLSPSYSPLLIRTTMPDFSRLAEATVSTLEMFEWNKVTLIYEDMEFSNAIIPYLTDALVNKDIQLSHKIAIPTFPEDFQILERLEVLMSSQSEVFVVHMSSNLATRLFVAANKEGMMGKGFAWLVTDGLSNFVDTMDPIAIGSMKGVIGLRPYIPKTTALKNFRTRYKRISSMKQNKAATKLNLLGLWLYDIVWGFGMTVERIGNVNSGFLKEMNDRTWLIGILNPSFRGISGILDLVNRQFQPSVFEIFNITGKRNRVIGYWTNGQGTSKNNNSTSRNTPRILQAEEPTRAKWRIGVPSKKGFTEFVNIQSGNKSNDDELPGFSIEVFRKVWDLALTSTTSYEFVNIDGTYDDLCCQVKYQEIHAAVGDISIVGSRTNCVDFTLPYLETGVAMLIKVRHNGPKDMWIFLKPLSWDLWLVIIAICIFIGIVVRVLERRENTEFNGSARKQLSTILMFPCQSVAIPQRDMVVTNGSRLVLVVWIFLALILMQSYTANLSSILTVNQLQPTIPSIKELRKSYVGYQNHSFVKGFLINQLGFQESMLKPYCSVDDYQEALSKGSENEGVSAIFDEIPYIKLFLAQYTTGYLMVGPTYRTDGLGFALPIGSPMVANFSRAILNFTQGKYMNSLEKKYFGMVSIDQDETGAVSSASPSLTSRSFAGLFIIISIIVLLALLSSKIHILRRLIQRYIFSNSGDIAHPPQINNVEENHNSNQNNRDESIEEGILEGRSS